MNKINSYENRLVIILCGCFGLVFFDRLAMSFLFPFVAQELQLNNTHLGLLSSTLALTWALSGILLGAYADRAPSKKALLIVMVLAFSILSALSGAVTSFISLLIYRALMGVAEGAVLPISQSLLAAESTPHRRGLNMGLVNATAPGLLGSVIAPPLLIAIATSYGWRNAFYVTIIPGLIMALLVWLYIKNCPTASIPKAERVYKVPVKYKDLLKNRNILICMLISCFYISWFITIISFTPTFLITVKHFPPETMGKVMSVFGIASVFWGFVVSAISDQIGRKPAVIFFSIIATFCPLTLLYADTPESMMLLVFFSYTGLGCFTLFMATIPAETVAANLVATSLGLIMGVGEVFGGFVTPTIAGIAADRYGLSIVMWIAAGGSLIATILSCFLIETAPIKLALLRKT
ncbi:MFS transporter [Iodobacter arcticus]|uniref:MFS transporter n=1 Tax=Iodobacter arcticus TaxID=590593 RepID=A0ABW2QVD6_9NEIS